MTFSVGTGFVVLNIPPGAFSFEVWVPGSTSGSTPVHESTLASAQVLRARLKFGPCGSSREGTLRLAYHPGWVPFSKIIRVALPEGRFYAGLVVNVVPDGRAWSLELAGLHTVGTDGLVADPAAPSLPGIPGVVAAGGRNLGAVSLTANVEQSDTNGQMASKALAAYPNGEWGVGGDLVNVIGRPDGSGSSPAAYAVGSTTLELRRFGHVLTPYVTEWVGDPGDGSPRMTGGAAPTNPLLPRRCVTVNPPGGFYQETTLAVGSYQSSPSSPSLGGEGIYTNTLATEYWHWIGNLKGWLDTPSSPVSALFQWGVSASFSGGMTVHFDHAAWISSATSRDETVIDQNTSPHTMNPGYSSATLAVLSSGRVSLSSSGASTIIESTIPLSALTNPNPAWGASFTVHHGLMVSFENTGGGSSLDARVRALGNAWRERSSITGIPRPPEADTPPYVGPAHEFKVGRAVLVPPLVVSGLPGGVTQDAASTELEISAESVHTRVLTSAMPYARG